MSLDAKSIDGRGDALAPDIPRRGGLFFADGRIRETGLVSLSAGSPQPPPRRAFFPHEDFVAMKPGIVKRVEFDQSQGRSPSLGG